ncbi:MAG: peptide deformylase [Clostridia bacterium]
MATRNIRTDGDPILRKKARTVEKFDGRLHMLLEDMADTMYDSDIGVGLAASQIGVLKRVLVYDTGDGIREMVNPEILCQDGSIIEVEGCLSVPDVYGEVERPEHIKVRYQDRFGNTCTGEMKGFLSVVACHEMDHLEGILFTDKVIRYVDPAEHKPEGEEEME